MAYSAWFGGWLEWRSGDRKPGLAAMRNSLARQAEQGSVTTFFETLLAEAEAEAGESDVAFCTMNHALAASSEPGCIGTTPKPIASAARSFSGATRRHLTAEEAFQRAIAVAGEQGARSFRCAQPCRSPSSINRPTAPPRHTPFLRLPSKGFHRRWKCRRSRRRISCWWLSSPAQT